MRVKSENGVVFAGETTNVNSFCGFLASSSWVLCSKVRMSEQKKAKKTKKAVFFLSFSRLKMCVWGVPTLYEKRTAD